jgi:2-hydroxy-6-oxonona-2,4-dienedioate hydrolase
MNDNALPDLQVGFVALDGGAVRYLRTGSGPALLLLHPVGFSAELWLRNLRELGRSFTVFAPDLYNHGFSALVDYAGSVPQDLFARQALAFADAMGVQRMSVAGSSLGAHVAALVYFMAPERVRHLVIIGSGTSFSPESELAASLPNTYANAMRAIESPSWDKCITRMRNLCFDLRDVPTEIILPQLTSYARPGFREAYDATLKGMMDLDRVRPFRIAERLDKITVPTQIIWGRQDPRSKVENAIDAAGRIRDCELLVLENCGHLPYLEYPQQFNAAVAAFLSREPAEG